MASQPARTGAAKAGSFGRKRRLRQRWQLALVHMEPARNILFIPSQQPHRAHGGCRVDKTPNPSHFNHLTPPPTDTHQQTQTKPRQPATMRVSSHFPSVTRVDTGCRLFSLSSPCNPCRLSPQTKFWYSLLRLLRNLCVFCVHPRIPLRPLRSFPHSFSPNPQKSQNPDNQPPCGFQAIFLLQPAWGLLLGFLAFLPF